MDFLVAFSLVFSSFALCLSIINYQSLRKNHKVEFIPSQKGQISIDILMHFTDRFIDLHKSGSPAIKLKDPDWMYQFWSLHASEFYFFQHGLIPSFMYILWMADLTELYGGPFGEKIWNSHKYYMEKYVQNYPEMEEFFVEIYAIAKDISQNHIRNEQISKSIESWISTNKKDVF